MPGFLRSLALAAVEGYNNAKEQQAQAQRDAYALQQQSVYASPPPYQQQWQPPQPQQAPSLPPRQQTVHNQSPPPRTHSSTSPGCAGHEAIRGNQIYITPIAPDLDICPSCYTTFILPSPFSPNFHATRNPSPGHKTCDLAVKGVRDAFKEACTRAQTGSEEIYFQRFATQASAVMSRVAQLGALIRALKEQVQVVSLQAQYTQASALNQIMHGASVSSINAWGGSGYYYDRGGLISAAGNQRFSQATQMKMDVAVKEYELKKAVGELRALIGRDEMGRALWN